jgi:hypothetical protein
MSALLKQAIQIATKAVELDTARDFVDALAHYDQCLDMLKRARTTEKSPSTVQAIDGKVAEYSKRANEIRATLSATAPSVPDDVPDFDDDDDNNTAPAPVPPKVVAPVKAVAPPAVAPPAVAVAPPAAATKKLSIVSEVVDNQELVITITDDPNTLQALLTLGHRATEADRANQFERAFPLYRHLATSLMRLAKLESNVRARETMLTYVKQYTDRAEQLRSKPASQSLRGVRVERFVESAAAVPVMTIASPASPPKPLPLSSSSPSPSASVHLVEIDRVWADIQLVPFIASSNKQA